MKENCVKIVSDEKNFSAVSDIFQPAVGKSVPDILFLLSYAKLLVIAAHGGDVQRMIESNKRRRNLVDALEEL